ncbi:RNA helicase required for poly(A+) mRNA export [Hypoxylon texense]
MAFEFLPYCILVWILIQVGFAAGVELGDDIKNLVPPCAQPCLESFIVGNYPSTACTRNPTLQCLCVEQSNTGYTLGEGALQCISAEAQRGVCTKDDVSGSIPRDAYLMCNNIKNALPNTHSVLTATIADSPTGSAGSLILSSMPTATPTGTSTPSGTITPAPTSTPSTGPAPTETPAAVASAPALNTAQIAGIVAGVVGTILITLVAIFIARCIRRRRYPELEDGLLPADDNKSRSTVARSKKSSSPLVISAPFRRFSHLQPEPRLPQQNHTPPPRFPILTPPLNPRTPPNPGSSPRPYLSSNPTQEAIGLAISRSLNSTPSRSSPEIPSRPASRLLPAKPSLSLKIPPAQPPPPPQPLPQPQAATTRVSTSQTPHTDRASVLTNMTGFADLDTEAPEGGQIWRPPPSDPQSATTLYVADKWGNWVLSNNNRQSDLAQVTEAAELDTYTPLTKSPIEKREEAAAAMSAAISAASASALPERPQPAFLSKDRTNNTLNRSSSVYSQASVVRHNSRVLTYRTNSTRRGNPAQAQITRSDTMISHGSATTINTSSSSPFDEEVPFELDPTRLSQLSTVMETPSPTTGRSPVTYPKIPGRLNQGMLKVVPPKRPDFGSPPGQPSPTLKGAAVPANETGSPYPQPLKPRRPQRPRTPNLRMGPDAEQDLQKPPRFGEIRPQAQSPMARFAPQVPDLEAPAPNFRYPERLRTPPMQTSGSGFSPNPPNVEAFPTPSPMSSRSGHGETSRPHVARAISPLSMTTAMTSGLSGASGASSLLAKRIGNDRAAALALGPNSKKRERWRRNGDPNNMLTPDDPGLLSPKGTLPLTPTWLPKLTPTRHGDDLVLNVQ